jgi:hypothetical protein
MALERIACWLRILPTNADALNSSSLLNYLSGMLIFLLREQLLGLKTCFFKAQDVLDLSIFSLV